MPTTPKADEKKQDSKKDEGHNDFVHQLLVQAEELHTTKEELFQKIGANRDVLRKVKETGLLSANQADAVDEFYPQRKAADKSGTNGGTAQEPPADPEKKPATTPADPANK